MVSSKTVGKGVSSTNGDRPAHGNPIPMRVAFQGDRGAYAELAIAQIWRHPVESVPVSTFSGALRAVEHGSADACVIPVANSIIGRVDAGWQAVAANPHLRGVTEARVSIRHCLLAPKGATLEGLRSAASHPVALAQCVSFFEKHSWIKPTKFFDTAGAAREIAERGDPTQGAIASRTAGERYGLVVLSDEIQDSRENYTSFVAVVSDKTNLWRRTHAIRGATSVSVDDPQHIAEATRELLEQIVVRNWLEVDEIISVWFTVTPDLTAAFPALAAREMGWVDVPLLCASEIPVPGSMARCLRTLIEVEPHAPRRLDTHVYLRDAVALRPDIHAQITR